jgi:superfamily I DNA/RNA helicase
MPRLQLVDDLQKWYAKQAQRNPQAPRESAIQREEVNRAIKTALQLMRQCKYPIRDSISQDGATEYIRSAPKATAGSRRKVLTERLELLRSLVEIIQKHQRSASPQEVIQPSTVVNLTEITDAIPDTVSMSTLRHTMQLLDSSGLCSLASESDEQVSVVTLQRTEKLATYDPERRPGEDHIQDTYKELEDRFRLQELQTKAMEHLVVMPENARTDFIDRYFEAKEIDDIRKLLDDSIGDADDLFFAEFNKLSDQQKAVCRAPYDRNIIVNAGPGSGKTHVLVMRCAHLIHRQGIKPPSILVLAFNRSVVLEIRERIRNLFRKIGYGNYASRIDVRTFDAFALRHHPTDDANDKDAWKKAVHAFADKLTSSPQFAQRVAQQYRAILVDEFQDMTADRYKIVKSMIEQSGGGGMVIGDDDQDISMWIRRDQRSQDGDRNAPLGAYHYFKQFEETFEPTQISLTTNYRSTQAVVARAEAMVRQASDAIGFRRAKTSVVMRAYEQIAGEQTARALEYNSRDKIRNREDTFSRIEEALLRGDQVAVLCLTNAECLQIYRELRDRPFVNEDQITLLRDAKDRRELDFKLRELRAPAALLDLCDDYEDNHALDQHTWQELKRNIKTQGLADTDASVKDFELLYDLCRKSYSRPTTHSLQQVIRELRMSDLDLLQMSMGSDLARTRITVSTIHKVKGMEYDTVVVPASTVPFPLEEGKGEAIEDLAAEQARLYYVALTRARTHFCGGWGPREQAWLDKREYPDKRPEPDAAPYRLRGSLDELFYSLSGQTHLHLELDIYIASEVSVGDELTLKGRNIFHRDRHVGTLEKKVFYKQLHGNPDGRQIRVANVIRRIYPASFPNDTTQEGYWKELHPQVQSRRWHYVVLVEDIA